MPDLPKDGRTYRIWSVVEDLILDRYADLEGQRMRDSYYLLREWLEPHRDRGDITDAEFDYFVNNYEYYRDSFWPRMEKNHGLERPMTKPPTIVIENGNEYTEQHIDDAWHRARGFLFVEKSGMASDLSELSEHGWLIVAAQGESTRTFRERVAEDGTDRPVLVVTDADFYGTGITDSLKGHSERTEHLELWKDLDHRVREIGLDTADADALDLPRERDPTQSPDKWRTELNALTVLQEREGIMNPLLSYVTAKMRYLDIPLTPLPVTDPEQVVRNSLRTAIENALSTEIEAAVDEVMDGLDATEDIPDGGDGGLMNLMRDRSYAQSSIDTGDLRDDLEDVAQTKLDALSWRRQSKYEEAVVEEVGEDDVQTIEQHLQE